MRSIDGIAFEKHPVWKGHPDLVPSLFEAEKADQGTLIAFDVRYFDRRDSCVDRARVEAGRLVRV